MKLKNLWLSIGGALVVLVIVVSLIPNPPNPAEFKGSDKVGHFSAYAFMMLWFAQIYARNRTRWVIALGLILIGIALECLQGLSGYRTFEYADMGANTAGVLFALLLAQTPLSRCLAFVERYLLKLRT
jgi:VanZ family protein